MILRWRGCHYSEGIATVWLSVWDVENTLWDLEAFVCAYIGLTGSTSQGFPILGRDHLFAALGLCCKKDRLNMCQDRFYETA